jgi:hypothetical protein
MRGGRRAAKPKALNELVGTDILMREYAPVDRCLRFAHARSRPKTRTPSPDWAWRVLLQLETRFSKWNRLESTRRLRGKTGSRLPGHSIREQQDL